MTHKEQVIRALRREPPVPGPVPHFELVFYLTMEALGKVHPDHRSYHQWDQMSMAEQNAHIRDLAGVYIDSARRFGHSAILLNAHTERVAREIRERTGDAFFLMANWDPTFYIPDGSHIRDFIYRIADDPQGLHREARANLDYWTDRAQAVMGKGLLDGLAMCSDYCIHTGPFLSPAMFSEFVTPYLAQCIQRYREMGFYTIKHTDGNIMPILDQLVQAAPDALHSLDPQAGVDIAQVKRLYGGRLCLIGNVNCGLMQTGTDEEVEQSVLYALRNGMPGGGYIFSTSNCVYTGMPLERYEFMLDIWRREGNYV